MQVLRIKQERISRGWTQSHVAKAIGLTRTAVHDIENGKQMPSYKILVKLEDLFELNHRDLFQFLNSDYSNLSDENNDTSNK